MANPEAQALLRIARRDLKAAEVLQIPSIDESSWGFQIQQAVEKSLKAWLFSLGEEPQLIHNLTALLERVADVGGDVEPFLALESFTVFAVQFRYDAEPEPMELVRRDWQQRAVELIHQLGAASECNKSCRALGYASQQFSAMPSAPIGATRKVRHKELALITAVARSDRAFGRCRSANSAALIGVGCND